MMHYLLHSSLLSTPAECHSQYRMKSLLLCVRAFFGYLQYTQLMTHGLMIVVRQHPVEDCTPLGLQSK